MTARTEPPCVFISYSHDSREHKQWVAEFATQLMHAGVKVILDQWDLSYGADLPKFMERGVRDADRVLLICTPAYVRKADDGDGGAGYEAMIVSAQLIRDLGTAKFIPVVRVPGDPTVPLALGTRFYVDLSSPETYDEHFQRLLRDLHGAPALRKPSLGKNPFAEEDGDRNGLGIVVEASPSALGLIDGTAAYKRAVQAIRAKDLYAWRRLCREAREHVRQTLPAALQDASAKRPNRKEQCPEFVLTFAGCYEPLLAIALAGVESGDPQFCNQASLLDEILNPPGWSRGGYNVVVALPRAVAFIYQALHGAVCVETGQLSLARRLARTRVEVGNSGRKDQLFRSYDLVGYGDSFLDEPQLAWETLKALPERWPWLAEMFGNSEDFRVALVAYYLLLNTMELVADLAGGREIVDSGGHIIFGVPLMFSFEDADVRRRSYAVFIRNPADIREVLRESDVVDAKFKQAWSVWVEQMKKQAADGWSPTFRRANVPHAELAEDLDGEPSAG